MTYNNVGLLQQTYIMAYTCKGNTEAQISGNI